MRKELTNKLNAEGAAVPVSTSMTKAIDVLLTHPDPEVRAAGVTLREGGDRRKRILELVQEALQQLRLDMKYLVFDLEATRRERDDAKKEGDV